MNLKDKRRKAFVEYIETIYKIENLLHSEKDKILKVPSIYNVLDDNIDKLSIFDLLFSSIQQIKRNYITRYSLLTEFLEQGIYFNKKYKLGYIKEIDTIKNKINEIKEKSIILKNEPTISPYDKFKDVHIKEVIEFYDEYVGEIQQIILHAHIHLTEYNFNYRKYFKDGFLKYIKKLNILIDLTSGSYNRIINMQTYHITSSEE